jgi:DNA recombination protein RmuC
MFNIFDSLVAVICCLAVLLMITVALTVAYIRMKRQYEAMIIVHNEDLIKKIQQEDIIAVEERKRHFELELNLIEKRHQQLISKIDQLSVASAGISAEAFKLTHILTGSNTHQGAWGEMVLSQILNRSGMREGHEYHTQYNTGAGIPDVIITLPNGNKVVIDAKVSLTSYSKIHETSCPKQAKVLIKKHLTSLYAHISSLQKKNYTDVIDNSIDCVIMFMPVESAFIEAIKHSPDFLESAFASNIIVVGPNGLFATLKVFAKVWREDYVKTNIKDILFYSSKMKSNTYRVVEGMTKWKRNFEEMNKAYSSVMGLLSEDKESLLDCINQIENRNNVIKGDHNTEEGNEK